MYADNWCYSDKFCGPNLIGGKYFGNDHVGINVCTYADATKLLGKDIKKKKKLGWSEHKIERWVNDQLPTLKQRSEDRKSSAEPDQEQLENIISFFQKTRSLDGIEIFGVAWSYGDCEVRIRDRLFCPTKNINPQALFELPEETVLMLK
jgi:hypothetical protein